MRFTVSLARCGTYDEAVLRPAVEAVLAPLGGLDAFVRPGQRVLLKLNLLSDHPPERAVTTQPELVRVLVRMVQERGARPVVGDSPGGARTAAGFRALLRKTGIQAVLDETGAELADFDGHTAEVTAPPDAVFRRFTVARAPLDADVVIALPRLKTHELTGLTCAVKLAYGYLPGLAKPQGHLHSAGDLPRFSDLVVDLHRSVPCHLVVADAVVAMEGQGPSQGRPRSLGLLLAGTSAPAVDWVAARVVGMEPTGLPLVQAALRRGLGPAGDEDLDLRGVPLEAVRVSDFAPPQSLQVGPIGGAVSRHVQRLVSARPEVDREACVACGQCIASCPPGALTAGPDGRPRLDLARCIRCWCCAELCPVGAARVRPPRLRLDPRGHRLLGLALDLGLPLREHLRRIRPRGSR